MDAIWNVAARLSEKTRPDGLPAAVREDMDLLEIAEVTGMKEGTVKTHLFRAVRSVREGLGEQDESAFVFGTNFKFSYR